MARVTKREKEKRAKIIKQYMEEAWKDGYTTREAAGLLNITRRHLRRLYNEPDKYTASRSLIIVAQAFIHTFKRKAITFESVEKRMPKY